jgi:hypothetical protein
LRRIEEGNARQRRVSGVGCGRGNPKYFPSSGTRGLARDASDASGERTVTLVALRAATEPVKEEAMQAILEDLMCVCERVFVCGRWRQNEKNNCLCAKIWRQYSQKRIEYEPLANENARRARTNRQRRHAGEISKKLVCVSVTDSVDSAIPTHFCRKNRRPTKMKRLGFGTLFHPNFSIARRVEGIDELINRGNQAETRLEKICAVADLFRRTSVRLLESAL